MLTMVANYKGREIVKEPIDEKDFNKLVEFHNKVLSEKNIQSNPKKLDFYTYFDENTVA